MLFRNFTSAISHSSICGPLFNYLTESNLCILSMFKFHTYRLQIPLFLKFLYYLSINKYWKIDGKIAVYWIKFRRNFVIIFWHIHSNTVDRLILFLDSTTLQSICVKVSWYSEARVVLVTLVLQFSKQWTKKNSVRWLNIVFDGEKYCWNQTVAW